MSTATAWLLFALLAALLCVGSCGTNEEPCQLGYRRDPGSAQCMPCPTCFQDVAQDYNETVELYQELLDRLNLTGEGGLSADLLARLLQYNETLNELLQTAVNVTDKEPQLLEDVREARTEAEGYRDLIDQFKVNVSAVEDVTVVLTSQANNTEFLLMELQRLVQWIKEILQDEVRTQLEKAEELYQEYLQEFDQLMEISSQANMTASGQYSLASGLLSQAKLALNQSREAFNLLCQAIGLQEQTTATLDTVEADRLPVLLQLYEDARDALLRVEEIVPSALNQSKIALNEIMNTFIPSYNTTSLDREVDVLFERTTTISQSTNLLDSQLTALRVEFSTLSENASRLLNDSKDLRNKAGTIQVAVHGANSHANDLVVEGQLLFDRANGILDELKRRLAEMVNFTAGLEELLMNIRLAESKSLEAEEEGLLSAQEVNNATRLAGEATQQLVDAERYLTDAMEAAMEASNTITQVLSNATTLNSTSQDLASEVRSTDAHIASLETQARIDQDNIAEAKINAQEAIMTAEAVQTKIQELQEIVQQLSEELEATELLPPGRVEEVENITRILEEQAEDNQVLVDELTEQVGQLQESSQQLRERYTDLQQHSDLLQSILDTIEPLDCRFQFSG